MLRTSPDAKKKNDSDRLLPIPYENPKDIEKQINNNTLSVSQSSTAGRNSYQPSLYYFSVTGTPTQQNFSPSSSNSTLTTQPEKDLNKIIDTRINQKLWIVEQTLSRHYLSGFRLRNYDVDFKKFGYDDNETLTPPTVHHNWNDIDLGVRTSDQNSPGNYQMSSSLRGSQFYQSSNSLNSEEQRPEYPNITIGQVPFEKKHRGESETSEIINIGTAITGASTSTSTSASASTPPSSYLPNIPIQLQPRSNLARQPTRSSIQQQK